MKTFIVPGINGSDAFHWQTMWEQKYGYIRINQKEWAKPLYSDWEEVLVNQILAQSGNGKVRIIAHSLGCILVAKALDKIRTFCKEIILVAPADLDSCEMLRSLDSFQPLPRYSLDISGTIIFSRNDPFASPEYSQFLATVWGLDLVDVGYVGHINSESNLGGWDAGHEVLKRCGEPVAQLTYAHSFECLEEQH